MSETTLRVAVVQAASVLFDRDASIDKAGRLIAEAASGGAKLVLFPEAFVPAYPRGLRFGTSVGGRTPAGRRTFQRYFDNAIAVPGPETDRLGAAAQAAGVWLAIGVIERLGNTLYCTLLYFGPDGSLLGLHRKLKPTAAERLIWGEGDGSTLTVIDTPFGKVGGLICWEHYMPLARMAMYQQGVDIWLAPTADQREVWQASMVHVALEGRCYVLSCNQFVTKAMYPPDLEGVEDLAGQPEILSRGGSVIVSPLGQVVAGPLWDQEGILCADLDLGEIARGKFDFDVAGHYHRPDVFRFSVNPSP